MASAIKFHKFYVSCGALKARVHYSAFRMVSSGKECVTVYAKDHSDDLSKVFAGVSKVENDSDAMTDYFEKSRVRILAGEELYGAALARVEANKAASAAK